MDEVKGRANIFSAHITRLRFKLNVLKITEEAMIKKIARVILWMLLVFIVIAAFMELAKGMR
ncbi:MAG: hypothetical protein WC592_08920 [Candidatus Omnitrophota bacterium]